MNSSNIRGVVLAVALTGALTAIGCDKSEQKEAAEEQAEAQADVAEAQREANEKVAEAKREADEAAAKAAKARSEGRAALQQDVDAVDRKISYLKERASAVKGAAKKNADAAQAEVDTRRSSVREQLAKLEAETGAAWDSAKTEAEKAIKSLNDAVESWESTVTGKPAR